jgi:amino acid adenylation domain-containing protein
MLDRSPDRQARPDPGTLVGFVRDWARRTPGAPAILSPVAPLVSYGQLAVELHRVGEELAGLGIGASDRVAIVPSPGADMVVSLLAVAGHAACAPLNPAYTPRELEVYLSRLRPKGIMTGKGSPVLAVAQALGIPVLDLDAGSRARIASRSEMIDAAEPEDGRPEVPALLLFTSGTTGRPKLVALTEAQLVGAAGNIASALQLSPSDRCLGVMPLFHIHGLSTLLATLYSGGCYVSLPAFSPAGFGAALEANRPTWYSASPAFHRAIVDEVRSNRPPVRTLRFVRSASAPITSRLATDIEATLGAPLIEAYGMTEAAPQIATNRPPPFERKPGSVGRPAGPDVAIVDGEGRFLGSGETGEIVVRGANVITRYEGDSEADQEAFIGDWLRTGDLGRLDDDAYLFVTGRLKDVVNRGGEKIAPGWVEQALLEHPAIAEAVVFGVPDAMLGETVAAAVVLLPDARPAPRPQEIREFVAARLARFEVPQRIFVVESIPAGPNGKVRRRDLAAIFGLDRDSQSEAGMADRTQPRSAAEQLVATAFAEVLKLDSPGIHADFLDLGGNSLSAMQIVARLEAAFGITLPVEVLFAHPTIAQVSGWIGAAIADMVATGARTIEAVSGSPSSRPRGAARGATARDPAAPAPLSPMQRQVYFLDRMGSGAAYNMSASLSLTGPVDHRSLARALQELCRRHESLRTRFLLYGDGPVQMVDPPPPEPVLEIIDLRDLPGERRASEAETLMAEAAARPFDLERGPLFRSALIRVAEEESILLLTMHHMVCDGWSVAVLHEELRQLYRAFRVGTPSPLPDLPLQYADFVLRQDLARFETEAAYWVRRLHDAPPLCTFPSDRPRPLHRSYRGRSFNDRIDRELVDRLNAIARPANATLFMTLLAAFEALLFRHNRQEDCVVGIPVANRSAKEFEPVVGFFANSLALRTSLAGDPSFVEVLERVRETALEAFANQSVPLERIVDDLKLARDPSRTPLFQVMFAFQKPGAAMPFEMAPGLLARPLRLDSGSAKFDLTLYLSEGSDGVALEWQYDRDLYDPETVRDLAAQFHVLLEGVAADPEARLSQLPLLSAQEAHLAETEWSLSSAATSPGQGFLALFDTTAHRAPESLAVTGGGEPYSYRRLAERANQLAVLFRDIGVREGSAVGVCLPRIPDAVAVQLAIWKAGGAYLPLDPRYPPERTAFAIRDAAAKLIVTTSDLLPTVHAAVGRLIGEASARPQLVCIDAVEAKLAAMSAAPIGVLPSPDALAYVIYTSGSTGKPKGVAITRANLDHYAEALPLAIGLRSDDRYLHTASFSFSSSIRQVVAPLSRGACVVMATEEEVGDPEKLFETIRDSGATVVDLVPSFSASCLRVLRSLDQAARESLMDNGVRLVLSASEPLPAALVGAWRRLFPHGTTFVNMFGQTETAGIVLVHPILADSDGGIVPAGKPIANTEVYILDGGGHAVPAGVCGDLYIGGAGVGRGYIGDRDDGGAGFVSLNLGGRERRLFRTGDIARCRRDGVIEFVGRADRQMKVRGFRVAPEEIEQSIGTYPGVRECAVALEDAGEAMPDGRLVAYLAYDGTPDDDATLGLRIRAFLRQKLPHYMVPERLVHVASLPRTPSGKLDLSAAREGVLAGEREAGPSQPADLFETPTVEYRDAVDRLTEVWRKVLDTPSVGTEENFFDLGGNSRLCISVMVEAKRLGLDLTLDQIYRHQTIAALARAVLGDRAATHTSLEDPSDAGLASWLTVESLRAYGREALMRAGLDREGAEIVTEVQLEASLRGQQTHDMVSIPRYATRIAAGRINPRPDIRIERETPTTAAIDGDNGPGQWVSTVAMDVAIGKAREHGIGIVTVRRSNHFGAAGQYVWQATRSGLIGLCTTNGPAVLAPTGGVTPTFGNNPLGLGIPAGRHFPILLDIAMSVAPRSKIGLAVGEGDALPPGWILDGSGKPSTDLADLAAGLGVPIGGHKGYGLALVLEVLSGVLSGAGFGAGHRPDVLRASGGAPDFGHLFMALDPRRFLGMPEFTDRVDALIEQTKSGERAHGVDEIFIPGERELRARERGLSDGVRLRPSTYRVLLAYGRRMGLDARLIPVASSPRA